MRQFEVETGQEDDDRERKIGSNERHVEVRRKEMNTNMNTKVEERNKRYRKEKRRPTFDITCKLPNNGQTKTNSRAERSRGGEKCG
jgi:hypothetical protein